MTKITIESVSGGSDRSPRWQWTIEHEGETFASGDKRTLSPPSFANLQMAANTAAVEFENYCVSPRFQQARRERRSAV